MSEPETTGTSESDQDNDAESCTDQEKFNLAVKLLENIETVRKSYQEDLNSEDKARQQRGVILYLLDKMSFRAGSDDKSATGVCTLKKNHITLIKDPDKVLDKDPAEVHKHSPKEKRATETVVENSNQQGTVPSIPEIDIGGLSDAMSGIKLNSGTDKTPTKDGAEETENAADVCTSEKSDITSKEESQKFVVHFNFQGKCVVPYNRKHSVEPKVFQILEKLKENGTSDKLFPDMNARKVNRHLKKITNNKDITMKFFRTYKASLLVQEELEKAPKDRTINEKKAKSLVDDAMSEAANHLNHQHANRGRKKEEYDLEKKSLATSVNGNTSTESDSVELPEGREWYTKNTKEFYVDPRVVILWCIKNGVSMYGTYMTKEASKNTEWAIDDVCEKLKKELKEKGKFVFKNYYPSDPNINVPIN